MVGAQRIRGRLSGISSMATRGLLAELSDAYERGGGGHVGLSATGGVEAAKRVRAGEPFDIVVLASDVMAGLETERFLRAGTLTAITRSKIAMAVRSGLTRPALGDAADVRRAVLGAKRIAYSTGPSGDHLMSLFARWAISREVADRLVQAPPGVPVGTLLARGDAELGFQQMSELMGSTGIEVVGPLPDELQGTTVFSAGVGSASALAAEAARFIQFLASPDADAAKLRHGMEPA